MAAILNLHEPHLTINGCSQLCQRVYIRETLSRVYAELAPQPWPCETVRAVQRMVDG